jgi:hypothetical protein
MTKGRGNREASQPAAGRYDLETLDLVGAVVDGSGGRVRRL